MNWDTESTAPTYGEWHDFAATVTFPEAWDVPMAKYTVLKFSGPEDGIEITVDYARLSLPDPVSFVSSCSNMIPNGDQEKNGPSAYPMRLNHDRYPPVYWPDSNVRILSIREGFGNETNSTDLDSMGGDDTDTGFNGTNFFSRVAGRYYDWHGPSFREIPPVCIQPQSVYRMSMKVRLHEPETGDAADKFPFFSELRAHYLEENGETYRHYATRKLGTSCDPIDISDGWVTVSCLCPNLCMLLSNLPSQNFTKYSRTHLLYPSTLIRSGTAVHQRLYHLRPPGPQRRVRAQVHRGRLVQVGDED